MTCTGTDWMDRVVCAECMDDTKYIMGLFFSFISARAKKHRVLEHCVDS